MDEKELFIKFLEVEKHRISLSLGECRLDSELLGRSDAGMVFKGRMNGNDVTVKFFLYRGDSSDKKEWLNKLKAE